MPFNGLHPFLLVLNDNRVAKVMYQCPLTGFIHFYIIKKNGKVVNTMYQCPLTGFIHFYDVGFYQSWTFYGINAL